MKLDLVPESPLERFLLAAGLVPTPVVHTMLGLLMSRSIMAAARFGMFEALSSGLLTPAELATRCGTEAAATGKLLRALETMGYVRSTGDRYGLSPMARQWLTNDGRHNLNDALLHRYLDIRLIEETESYLLNGRPTAFHRSLSPEEWGLYVRGQKSHASVAVSEIIDKIPVPKGATSMLDVGGSHGLYSDSMCARQPNLHATVLDLPEAIEQVDRTSISDRVTFRAGDVLSEDFGERSYDLVLIVNFNHHFTLDQNKDLLLKVSRTLRTDGICAIVDFVLPAPARRPRQITALLDLYFALTSGGGAYKSHEILDWMRVAGLATRRPIRIRRVPGVSLMVGEKRE